MRPAGPTPSPWRSISGTLPTPHFDDLLPAPRHHDGGGPGGRPQRTADTGSRAATASSGTLPLAAAVVRLTELGFAGTFEFDPVGEDVEARGYDARARRSAAVADAWSAAMVSPEGRGGGGRVSDCRPGFSPQIPCLEPGLSTGLKAEILLQPLVEIVHVGRVVENGDFLPARGRSGPRSTSIAAWLRSVISDEPSPPEKAAVSTSMSVNCSAISGGGGAHDRSQRECRTGRPR